MVSLPGGEVKVPERSSSRSGSGCYAKSMIRSGLVVSIPREAGVGEVAEEGGHWFEEPAAASKGMATKYH